MTTQRLSTCPCVCFLPRQVLPHHDCNFDGVLHFHLGSDLSTDTRGTKSQKLSNTDDVMVEKSSQFTNYELAVYFITRDLEGRAGRNRSVQ